MDITLALFDLTMLNINSEFGIILVILNLNEKTYNTYSRVL